MKKGGGGVHVEEKQACESVVEGSRDIQQHRRRATISGRRREMVEKGKAKVYESKGTPNYSYTIHD